jgi:hypothetical protein
LVLSEAEEKRLAQDTERQRADVISVEGPDPKLQRQKVGVGTDDDEGNGALLL